MFRYRFKHIIAGFAICWMLVLLVMFAMHLEIDQRYLQAMDYKQFKLLVQNIAKKQGEEYHFAIINNKNVVQNFNQNLDKNIDSHKSPIDVPPVTDTSTQSNIKSGHDLEKKHIYPDPSRDWDDRIPAQMKYIPESVRENANPVQKTIFLAGGVGSFGVSYGSKKFKECPVKACRVSNERDTSDLVIFHSYVGANEQRQISNLNQIWLLYMLESPYHTSGFSNARNSINWTASYRHDSTIVAPYERFVLYNDSVIEKPLVKNYAAGKTKKVAWFVSNCGASNSRLQYAKELQTYIEVDIFGRCGTLTCPRLQDYCYQKLDTEYKFYLSFENSNCRDYMTEKFFVNGLQHDVIPVVMGGSPSDYLRQAPHNSHIHVDNFASPKDLAGYLHKLDQNDNLYNEYFRWKGTGTFVNTYFWCRLCALLHDNERQPSWFSNLEKWWRGGNTCIGKRSWNEV